MKKSLLSLRGILTAATVALVALVSNAQSWDFTKTPEADAANLTSDTGNWTKSSTGTEVVITRWANKAKITDAALKANGSELEMTNGLKFTVGAADKIRIDQNSALRLNGSKLTITTPSLSAGAVVTVVCETANSTEARSISASNLTVTKGFTSSTERQTNIGTVTKAGPVTITTGNGMAFYSITIEGNTAPETPDTPVTPSTPDHSVAMNPLTNQMMLTTSDNTVKYYNTAELESVDIDKASGKVTVTPKVADWTDEYLRNVNVISFSKSAPTGSEGDITNGGVNITEAKGWLESVYAKWDPFTGATSYNVYIKGGTYADYTKIDRELVRDYGTYCRADMVGLPANVYTLKVVPVVGGNEDTASASEAADMEVKAHDRSGFAFHNFPGGIGAYKENGELKEGARVLYITKETAKSVSLDIQTGLKSGNPVMTTGNGLQDILHLYEKGYETRPLAIRFIGKVTRDDLDSYQSKEEGLVIKGKNYTNVAVTFEGIGDDATIHGFGLLIDKVSNVEFRNLGVLWFMDDAISIHSSSHLWVHHNDLFYGQPGSASDQVKGDGTLDIKDDSQYTTFAYNHLWDSGKASLCGMKSETGPNYIDYHHNWFDHSDSRHPRIRTMSVHVWNNYYDGVAKYGVGAANQSCAFVENNFFRNTQKTMLSSMQGSDINNPEKKGTFSKEDGGIIKSFGNLYAEVPSKFATPVSFHADNVEFDCYEAKTRDEQVPATVKAKQGGKTYDNFDTNPSLMHSYTPIPAADVPATVMGYYGAGRLNKGDFQWTFDNATEDKNYEVIPALQSAIKSYTSKLVKIF